MLKKALALTLAAVMLLMPMTASAVTWNQLVTGLRNNGGTSYTSEDNETTITREVEGEGEQKTTVIVVKGGTIQFGNSVINAYDDSAYNRYHLQGVTADTVYVSGEENQHLVAILEEDSTADEFYGFAGESEKVELVNKGSVNTMDAYAENGGVIVATNEGTVGTLYAGASKDGQAVAQNINGSVDKIFGNAEDGSVEVRNGEDGTVGVISVYGEAGSDVKTENRGTVESSMSTTSYGEGGTAFSQNDGTVEGNMSTNVRDGATGTAINNGSVDSFGNAAREGSTLDATNTGTANNAYARSENGEINFVNESEVGEFNTTLEGGATGTVENNGTIEFAMVDMYDGSNTTFSGDGEVNDGIVYVNTPSTDTYTQSELTEILKAVNLPNVPTELWIMDEDGNFTASYQITEDGELVLIEVFEEEEEEPYVEPDPVEEQRQLEGIGGVTTSPVWNWQGYLGHSSKPMWIYVNGEKTLMRQQLFWLGDSTKNHTCRVNASEPDPASIELRVGLDMLRTAKRAEISMISILDSENNPVAQFAVSDLMAAFEQYGLVEGELLCVSADADAEVMKVTLEGEYLPLEEKAE